MSVDDFILNLPSDERVLVSKLRTLLLESEPRFHEKLSYGVPYYSRNRRVCFIWPASAPLGPTTAKVSFGLCYGNLLSNSQGLLLSEGRKQVYIVRFSSLKEFDEKSIVEIIQESLMVDDLYFQKKQNDMSEPLKYMYNVQFFERLYPVLKEVIPHFEERKFAYQVFDTQWPELELKQRTRQVTKALSKILPPEYPKAVEMVISISNLLRKKEKEQSYPFIFLPEYIELYGIDHFSLSMKAIEESTKLVSAEFAIRPFIVRYPQETMSYMLAWSKHPEAAVRRLSSEGCRPRLPWAMGLPDFKKDPSLIIPILENLKDDPSEYVRRSVANNINDIAKDHPDTALRIAREWKGVSPGTDWIIKHGCRTLLKRGHEAVLNLHGFDPIAKASLKKFEVSKKVAVGDSLNFSFTFFSREKKSTRFRLEYVIDYITQSGKVSRKVFKLTENTFEPFDSIHFRRKQSFKDLTTRKHFKGKHYIRILSNGKELVGDEFFVV